MLKQNLQELVSACFTGIWIESHEPHEAFSELRQLCREQQWHLSSWDIQSGLTTDTGEQIEEATDPVAAINSIRALAGTSGTSIVVMNNLHKFVNSTEVIQSLQLLLISGKQNRSIIVGLSPVASIPTELQKLFVIVEHQLPSRGQIEEILRSIATEEGEMPEGETLQRVLDAASGLTRLEAENAFSLSLVRKGRVEADAVWELKSGMLKKAGLLQLYVSQDDFGTLGGLENLKALTKRSLMRNHRHNGKVKPRGILLLGVPGTGKSAFAKALGKETGRPTLILDIGALMGSLVGQSESNIRRALQIADAMEPCILFVDELEKALAGVSGNGQTDSGVSSRLFGTLLSWMNDHTSNVYLVATCNDISKMPPELSRAERFDAVVFLDLPGREQKDLIWQQYLQLFELDANQSLPVDQNWTGAEIRACCRLSALLDIPVAHAAQNVVPVAATAAESVNHLRSWSTGRCIDAEKGGLYEFKSESRRKIKRDSSLN